MKARNILIVSIELLCLLSCSKEPQDSPEQHYADTFCGTYYLEKAVWSTDNIDLNGDGIANEDLIYEFKNLQGFLEHKRFAKIYQNPAAQNEIDVDYYIPYHDVRKIDNNYYDYGCGYLESSFIGRLDSSNNPKLSFPAKEYNYRDDYNVALNGIHKSMINKFENGTMTIHVDATIYDCDYKPIAGTFYLYFKKI